MRQYLVAATTALVLITIYLNEQPIDEFEQWQQKHQKFYVGIERTYREKIYYENKKMIEEHNNNPLKTFTMKENQFTTLTNEEFIGLYLNQVDSNTTPQLSETSSETSFEQSSEPLKAIDWKNLISVKSQGNCQAGWAFSVSSSVEAFYNSYYGGNNLLSTQQIVDCDNYSSGCYGGKNVNAFYHVLNNKLVTESSYPFVGTLQGCKQQSGIYGINGYSYIEPTVYAMQQALQIRPVSVGVDVSRNWMSYNYGILYDCGTNINHYVLAVGFDENQNWIVRNSWGAGWGQNGTILLAPGNTCGILNQAYQVK